jgi:hypothetical protein
MKASTVQTIGAIITLASSLIVLSTPFVIGKKLKHNNYIVLLFFSLVASFVLSALTAYWAEDLSSELIYKLYGFDPYGMDESERWTSEITIEDRKTIERIYEGSFGMGWPIRLIISYVIFMIPYNLVVCGVMYGFKRKAPDTTSPATGLA